jgi:putative ATPase
MAQPVPLHLRNAPTALMKGLGYGKGYKYAHDFRDAKIEQEHLPDNIKGHKYYKPTDRGFEGLQKKRQAEETARKVQRPKSKDQSKTKGPKT